MKYGTSHAVLKPLEEVLLPDSRFQGSVIGTENQMRPFDLSDLHERLRISKLNSNVPKDVNTHFQTALNLMLYTWFVYEFQTVAEKQAYAALEFALRRRFPHATKTIKRKGKEVVIPWTLAPLLQLAMTQGLIVAETLPAWEQVKRNRKLYERDSIQPLAPMPSADDWLRNVIDHLPDSRNQLAHGSTKLFMSSSFWALEFCADLINVLFPKSESSNSYEENRPSEGAA
jgi:hypothetical protein